MSTASATPTVEQIRDMARPLPIADKLRLIEELARQIRGEPAPPAEKKPYRSLYGALADLGPAPSAEDIDEVRREMWANFPREEFYE